MKSIIITLSLLLFTSLVYADGQVHGVSFNPNQSDGRVIPATESSDEDLYIQKMVEFIGIQVDLDKKGQLIYNFTECLEAYVVGQNANEVCLTVEK